MKKKTYFGLSYVYYFKNSYFEVIRNWVKTGNCKMGLHLWDEVLSDKHYLFCDCCGDSVNIEGMEKSEIVSKYFGHLEKINGTLEL